MRYISPSPVGAQTQIVAASCEAPAATQLPRCEPALPTAPGAALPDEPDAGPAGRWLFSAPPGLTNLAVTKIRRLRFCALSPSERNSRPISGMLPSTGI